MTHDELLADIDSKNFRESRTPETPYAALRAVVKLHKPIISTAYPEFLGICLTCSPPSLNFYEATRYPCLTIQSIEKELG